MNLKQLRFNVKSLDDSAGEGVFSGYASTFGNKDLQGDVIAKGAFAETWRRTTTAEQASRSIGTIRTANRPTSSDAP